MNPTGLTIDASPLIEGINNYVRCYSCRVSWCWCAFVSVSTSRTTPTSETTRALKSREAISRYGVSAGEAGVSGASVAMGQDDLIGEWLNYSTRVTRQQELQNINTGLALTDAGYRTMQNQIGIDKPVNKPSFGNFLVGAVQQGVSGYATGKQLKKS